MIRHTLAAALVVALGISSVADFAHAKPKGLPNCIDTSGNGRCDKGEPSLSQYTNTYGPGIMHIDASSVSGAVIINSPIRASYLYIYAGGDLRLFANVEAKSSTIGSLVLAAKGSVVVAPDVRLRGEVAAAILAQEGDVSFDSGSRAASGRRVDLQADKGNIFVGEKVEIQARTAAFKAPRGHITFAPSAKVKAKFKVMN